MKIKGIHPSTKVFIFGFIAVLSLTTHTRVLLTLLALSILFAFISGGLKAGIKSLAFISPFIILTSIFSMFFAFEPPGGISGFIIRVSALIFITSFISSSMTIPELIYLAERFRVPDRILLYIISAFRFVPAIKRDLGLMLDSSKMEGMGKIRILSTLPLLIFSTALDRAEVLAMSMKVRNLDVKRLSYKPRKGVEDVIFPAITILPVILAFIT